MKRPSPPSLAPYFILVAVIVLAATYLILGSDLFSIEYVQGATSTALALAPPILDKNAYNTRELLLAHIAPASTTPYAASLATSTASSTPLTYETLESASTSVAVLHHLWPAAATYPDAGAILPFNRVVAYYGNFYSAQMGVLGEYPSDQVLAMLASTSAQWAAADPATPVIPAIDYIAVTAQASPGADHTYRLRMPSDQIDKALRMAKELHGLLFLDIQVGTSNIQTEVPLLAQYLKLPNVELSMDPEFSMKDGVRPGLEIGTYDASDINWSAEYLANLVTQYNLPPKILVVHRFTEDMVTNYKRITPLPQVEIVMDMDGWGSQAKKMNTYLRVIENEPVQFTGFKLFYKNDLRPPSTGLLTPAQVLNLTPSPSYIQYQ